MLDKLIIKLESKKEMIAYYEIAKNKNIVKHIEYNDIQNFILDGVEKIFIFIDEGISTFTHYIDEKDKEYYNLKNYRQITFEEFIHE